MEVPHPHPHPHPHPRSALALWGPGLAALLAVATLCAGCGGTGGTAATGGAGRSAGALDGLRSRLLRVAELPAGWRAVAPNVRDTLNSGPCLSGLPAHPAGIAHVQAGFVLGTASPTFGEALATGPRVHEMWRRLAGDLEHCRTASLHVAGHTVQSTVRPLPFPRVGDGSSAFAWSLTLSGVRIGFDLVLFDLGGDAGELVYSDLGPPPLRTVEAFANAAVAQAQTGHAPRIPADLSIASTPVRTIRTSLGTVAYRTIGSGPPLLLIMGYGASMESWDRRFVDALAGRHRVVIFDNAGTGQTQALPAPLTIDAMANQTSALITALRLGRTSVLGWSMGSMIAQALAVLHPRQVRRLVLCASWAGTGAAVPSSQQAIDALNSGNETEAMADLFPADQAGARTGYLVAVSSYPAVPPVPRAVIAAQGAAVQRWWGGQDPAGRQPGRITAPTLIADGTEDRLDDTVNSRTLAALIPRASLRLYPDAGHAFLFQDEATFVPVVMSFLRRARRP